MSYMTWNNLWKVVRRLATFFACGDAGEIVRSDDGSTWSQVPTPTTDTVTDISFSPDGGLGLASLLNTGKVLYSADGATWNLADLALLVEAQFGANSLMCHSTKALTASIGFLGTYLGRLFKTTDGGVHWSKQGPGAPVGPIYSLDALDENKILAAGTGGVALTTDGGASWTKVIDTGAIAVRGAAFVNATRAWACGGNGTVWRSDDGGATWTKIAFPFVMNWRDLSFADADHGFIVGEYSGTMKIVRTDDGGATWVDVTLNIMMWYGVSTLDALTAVVVGMSRTGVTHDGGATWTPVNGGAAVSSPDVAIGGIVSTAPDGTVTTTSAPAPASPGKKKGK